MAALLPTFYISHGGGPWPWLKKTGFGVAFEKLEKSLVELSEEVGKKPRAILVVTAHWEANKFLVSSAAHPGMVYDYYGFPPETYQIKYGAPGAPEIAQTVSQMLEKGGIPTDLDKERGFDHGTFSLMKILYPNEDMPILQLSIQTGYDPEVHWRVGELLAPLREQGVLIIGSGSSFHDLRAFKTGSSDEESAAFDEWLTETLVNCTSEERRRRLVRWENAPHARDAHPREDHLIPLMVVVGAACKDPSKQIYHEDDFVGSISISSFQFGDFSS